MNVVSTDWSVCIVEPAGGFWSKTHILREPPVTNCDRWKKNELFSSRGRERASEREHQKKTLRPQTSNFLGIFLRLQNIKRKAEDARRFSFFSNCLLVKINPQTPEQNTNGYSVARF